MKTTVAIPYNEFVLTGGLKFNAEMSKIACKFNTARCVLFAGKYVVASLVDFWLLNFGV